MAASFAFQKCYTTLKDIRHSLEQVVDEAFAKGLIPRPLKDKCHDVKSYTEEARTASLLSAIQDRVTAEPEAIEKFAKILQSTSGAEYIGKKLFQEYSDATKSELVVPRGQRHNSAPLASHPPPVVDGMRHNSVPLVTDLQTHTSVIHNPVTMEEEGCASVEATSTDIGGEQEIRENPPLPVERSSMGTLIHHSFPSLPATSPFVGLKPEAIPPSPTTTPTVVKEEDTFPQARKVPQVKEAVPRDQNEEVFPLMKEVFPLVKEVPQAKATSPQAREVPHNQAKELSPQAKCLAKTTSEHTSNVDEAASVTSSTALSPQDSNGGIQRPSTSSSTDSDYYMAESCLNCVGSKEKLQENILELQKSLTVAQEENQTLEIKLKSLKLENQQLKQEKEKSDRTVCELKEEITKLNASLKTTQNILSQCLAHPSTVNCNNYNYSTIQGGRHTFNQIDKRHEGDPTAAQAKPMSEVTDDRNEPVSFFQGCTNGYSLVNSSNNPVQSNHHDRPDHQAVQEEGAH